MRSMAIKINISKANQKALDEILEQAGYPHQRRKAHCTFGFIKDSIPEEAVVSFGDEIMRLLQEHIKDNFPLYEVGEVVHIFDHVVALMPKEGSLEHLHEVNRWLYSKVIEVSNNRWTLSEETSPQNFKPHMTVWRTRRIDKRFVRLKELCTENQVSCPLTEASYVVF